MAVREGTVAGAPARIFRISFTGELTYEVNVNANFGRHVWEAVMDAGEEYGITPFGTEAMHVLRAEKGYIIAGQDTDGSVTPVDLGMARMLGKNKDFLGKRSLFRSYLVRKDRKQFVGLLTEDPQEVLAEGGQIVDDPSAPLPRPMLGHVTSSYYRRRPGTFHRIRAGQGGTWANGRDRPMSRTSTAGPSPPGSPARSSTTRRERGRMSDLRQESPLVGVLWNRAAGDSGRPGVILTERPFLGYVNLRGDAGDALFLAAVEGLLSVALPLEPNTIAQGEDFTICWMGPDEWLLILPPGAQTRAVAALREALGEHHASAVDTTGGYTLVNVAGARRRKLLAKGCTLDLHPRSVSPGQCAQTNLGKAGVLLIPRGDTSDSQSFDVIVRRSFADYLGIWLRHSGHEYGPADRPRSRSGDFLVADSSSAVYNSGNHSRRAVSPRICRRSSSFSGRTSRKMRRCSSYVIRGVQRRFG